MSIYIYTVIVAYCRDTDRIQGKIQDMNCLWAVVVYGQSVNSKDFFFKIQAFKYK